MRLNRILDFLAMEINLLQNTKEEASEQGINRVLDELARCGNQFVGDIKEDLF